MVVFLSILVVFLTLFIIFCFTNSKVYVEFDNVSDCNFLKLKIYIFSGLLVFRQKKKIKSESKKQSIKQKLEMAINYLIKSRADPIEFVKNEIKNSDKVPDTIKKFDFSDLYLEELNLNLCLDLNNASLSAIGTGAANAIIGMTLAKYADNILGPVKYKVFPGYSGNGIKLEANAKIRVRTIEIIKLLFEKNKNIQRRKKK